MDSQYQDLMTFLTTEVIQYSSQRLTCEADITKYVFVRVMNGKWSLKFEMGCLDELLCRSDYPML